MNEHTEEHWESRDVLSREPDQLSEGQEDVLQEECSYWNWEWNPRCICTECYMG
jgi:hypothetical protein